MKRILIIITVTLLALTLTACGESRPFTWAIIKLDGETIAEGHVDSWHTYSNGDLIVEIDGKFYRTSHDNIVLMEAQPDTEKEREIHPC